MKYFKMKFSELTSFFNETEFLAIEQDRDKDLKVSASDAKEYEYIKLKAFDQCVTVKYEAGSDKISELMAIQVINLFKLVISAKTNTA